MASYPAGFIDQLEPFNGGFSLRLIFRGGRDPHMHKPPLQREGLGGLWLIFAPATAHRASLPCSHLRFCYRCVLPVRLVLLSVSPAEAGRALRGTRDTTPVLCRSFC